MRWTPAIEEVPLPLKAITLPQRRHHHWPTNSYDPQFFYYRLPLLDRVWWNLLSLKLTTSLLSPSKNFPTKISSKIWRDRKTLKMKIERGACEFGLQLVVVVVVVGVAVITFVFAVVVVVVGVAAVAVLLLLLALLSLSLLHLSMLLLLLLLLLKLLSLQHCCCCSRCRRCRCCCCCRCCCRCSGSVKAVGNKLLLSRSIYVSIPCQKC